MQELDPRERLLAAARDLFTKRGFDGTTTRDITRASGTSLSQIGHYFGDKEGLLVEIVNRQRNQILEMLHRVEDSGDIEPSAKFELLLREHLSMTLGDPSLVLIQMYEHRSVPAETARKVQREVLETYKRMLSELEPGGEIKSRNLSVLAFHILGTLSWVRTWFKPDGPLSHEEVIEDTMNFLRRGIFGQLRAQSAGGNAAWEEPGTPVNECSRGGE